VRGVYDQMARIAVAPLWARYYDFGTGRPNSIPQEAHYEEVERTVVRFAP
jgi:hypothetical protein